VKRIVTVLYQNPVERERLLARLSPLEGVQASAIRLSQLDVCPPETPILCWCADLPFALWIKEKSFQPLLLLHPDFTAPLFALLEDGRCACMGVGESDYRLTEQLERLFRRTAFVSETATYLTKRELEIVHLVASGFNTAEIAKRLSIQTSTVTSHKKRIFLKSGVRTTSQLVAWALLRSQRSEEREGRE
jgi:DNA-binding CsgD family transcriptional regulator